MTARTPIRNAIIGRPEAGPDGVGVGIRQHRVSELGHLVAARHRVDRPVITSRALALNFTNEGGVCGTTRLLKNIGGLWLLQSCRRHWKSQGQDSPYDALVAGADDERLAFRSLIDPDYPPFLNPTNMPATIAEYCRMTGQPEPDEPTAFARAILESLAFKYRAVLESLEELTGRRVRRDSHRRRRVAQPPAEAMDRRRDRPRRSPPVRPRRPRSATSACR